MSSSSLMFNRFIDATLTQMHKCVNKKNTEHDVAKSATCTVEELFTPQNRNRLGEQVKGRVENEQVEGDGEDEVHHWVVTVPAGFRLRLR